MSYLDSGYIAKFYVDEPDSPSVRRLTEALGEVHCAALGRAEVSAALHRKRREGVFGDAAFREVIAQFEEALFTRICTSACRHAGGKVGRLRERAGKAGG